MFTSLSNVARVSLGYKSLQNDFFYVNRATIDTFGIEGRYLQPILVFSDLDRKSYLQRADARMWIFLCRDTEADLRGTGALRYIDAMASRRANAKKQSQGAQTIREVLAAQGGALWYAPKAVPSRNNLWLRKAFDVTFSPFIFEQPVIVDQRCNLLEPGEGVEWVELAAVVTSTIFAYAVEVNGGVGMGAGALEAPTKKLRAYPVPDIRLLSQDDRLELVKLGRAVWSNESPVSWSSDNAFPGPLLRALDAFLLEKSRSSIQEKMLYNDLRRLVLGRVVVAADKDTSKKKRQTDSIGSVAGGIADRVASRLKSKRFPEDFIPSESSVEVIHLSRELARRLTLFPILDQAEIRVTGRGGKELLNASFALPVAELVARALLLGREQFAVPESRLVAEKAIQDFLSYFDSIRSEIDLDVAESTLGTGYDALLRLEVYRRLGVDPHAGDRILPHEVLLT